MAKLVKAYKVGNSSVNIIEGEYNGETTYSYTVQCGKYNKQTQKYEKSDFFNMTAMRDLYIAIEFLLNTSVKLWLPGQQPQQQAPQQQALPPQKEEVPFF